MNYQISIQDFEGPFDLLIHLVKEMKMDIYQIQTSEIIEGYLSYIHTLQDLNIDIASEFLVMASELVHLKSKMLIGKGMEKDEEESEFSIQTEEDLQKRILEYQAIKDITNEFKALEDKRGQVFTKVPENFKDYLPDVKLVNDGLTVDDLVTAFLNLQQRIHYKEPLTTKITRKEISIEARRKRIFHVLDLKKKVEFTELFEVWTKEYVVVTFLALLDMMKNQEVVVQQENNFEKIWIERGMQS